jgi:hypothetical protein
VAEVLVEFAAGTRSSSPLGGRLVVTTHTPCSPLLLVSATRVDPLMAE